VALSFEENCNFPVFSHNLTDFGVEMLKLVHPIPVSFFNMGFSVLILDFSEFPVNFG
jgi:hypothetical protein